GGVGPWLPFQMLAAGWVGLGAGLLPGAHGATTLGGRGALDGHAALGGRGTTSPGRRVRSALRGRWEVTMLAAYGAFCAYAYGFLLNIWFWPWAIGADTQVSFVAGASVLENLHRFFLFSVASSTFGWDTGRALTNVVAIVVLGPAILEVLRRAHRRAAFDAPVRFEPSGAPNP
ncbi:MAG: hypothetical protein ACK5O2_00160, partial [Microthrixaceae bacterium]